MRKPTLAFGCVSTLTASLLPFVLSRQHGHHQHHDHSHYDHRHAQQQEKEEGAPSTESHYCGTDDPTTDEMEALHQTAQKWLADRPCQVDDDDDDDAARSTSRQNPHCHNNNNNDDDDDDKDSSRQNAATVATATASHTIRIQWNSIAKDDGSAAATDQQIIETVAALNIAFAHPTTGGFAFVFDLATDKTYTENTDWHFSERWDMRMKSALRKGDCATLNIYSTGSFQGVFGWGTKAFRCDPVTQPAGDSASCYNQCVRDIVDDGVVIRYDLVKGGSNLDYNEGDVLVHEVGHWLGLFHTFQNGCDAPGDFIDDTPAQKAGSWGCDELRDTCKGDKDDPVVLDGRHNFMDVSEDACMFEFTNGQFAWMYSQWDAYRALNITAAPTPMPTTLMPTPLPTTAPTPFPTTIATPAAPVLNQQKDAPPEAKCGSVANQNGYGGEAAQAKDCNNRRLDTDTNTNNKSNGRSRRRRLKGA